MGLSFSFYTVMVIQSVQTRGNLLTNSTQLMKLKSSSVWDVPEFPISSIALVLVAMILAGLFVAVIAARMKKNKNQNLACAILWRRISS